MEVVPSPEVHKKKVGVLMFQGHRLGLPGGGVSLQVYLGHGVVLRRKQTLQGRRV